MYDAEMRKKARKCVNEQTGNDMIKRMSPQVGNLLLIRRKQLGNECDKTKKGWRN